MEFFASYKHPTLLKLFYTHSCNRNEMRNASRLKNKISLTPLLLHRLVQQLLSPARLIYWTSLNKSVYQTGWCDVWLVQFTQMKLLPAFNQQPKKIHHKVVYNDIRVERAVVSPMRIYSILIWRVFIVEILVTL